MSITDVSMIHHVAIVLFFLWSLSYFNCCHTVAYVVSLVYLYLVNEQYVMRLRRRLQFEEKRQSYQNRVLCDSESVRWLNYAIEKMWPVCMEHIVSQKILLPIIPWFLQKYKPWTAKEAVVHELYLGRSPPIFTEMRVLNQFTGDDHLVLELGMNFRTADDMSALLGVKLRKRLGFGLWAKLHLLGMHVEGKVLIGVKFLRHWPFLGRVRVCFVEPPYFEMTVKPLFSHGLDVTELPGIAGWLDKLLAVAFEQTLVEPNMLVIDVEKFASPQPENWFTVDEKEPIAYAVVEVVEATDMKPSDLNGLADPYVKGQVGPYRFRTKTQKKTLAPKWHEEFKIPICTWESPNLLIIEVRDKDHFVDDSLGNCSININDSRDGQRHDMWLSLQNIKMGRLHLAITVVESNLKADQPCNGETLNNEYERKSFASETAQRHSSLSGASPKSPKMADKFEPIDVEGQQVTGIWVHQPGSEASHIWEPRKGKSRLLDAQIPSAGSNPNGSFKSTASGSYNNDSSSNDESLEGNKGRPKNSVRRGLRRISSLFHRSSKQEDNSSSIVESVPSPHANLKATNAKQIGVKFIVEDNLCTPSSVNVPETEGLDSSGRSEPESPGKRQVKDMAKSIMRHAEKSARGIKHAFSRKGSRKTQGDPGLIVIERGLPVVYDSSDEESLPSSTCIPVVDVVPVFPSPTSSCSNDSFKYKEHVHSLQTTPTDPVMNAEEPSKVSFEDMKNLQTTPTDPVMNVEEPSKVSFEDMKNLQSTPTDPVMNVEEPSKVSIEDMKNLQTTPIDLVMNAEQPSKVSLEDMKNLQTTPVDPVMNAEEPSKVSLEDMKNLQTTPVDPVMNVEEPSKVSLEDMKSLQTTPTNPVLNIEEPSKVSLEDMETVDDNASNILEGNGIV
ncbi:C2 domain-containing protein At1g53590 isoform X2 [Cornus florida]|uniref:C2 domain-containing protein At1g53590 isoform X2 n=1 Tax=Cornus florida TaxID=4283 RepID=UPI00289E4929|nr:C2 domain-containing protein At1g53590 isoform X2 [Cornus florida]